ncbi:hypothetical protein [Candidatus Clostridium radicumherbarum]|uniref:Uncharacterized protein n=1 Tax=Candidatus Clostridium radicumherbarum TaxID=3381662 RepID=A0ABW8TQV4_9CLOT
MSLGRIGIIVLVSLAAYITYFTLKDIIFRKINLNKWIIFTLGLIIIFVSRFIGVGSTSIYSYILSGLFVIFLLWFYDLYGADNKKNTNEKKRR